jgi:CAAX prenyl protease-like protein
MTAPTPAIAPPQATRMHDIAYVAPMAVFLLFTAVGGSHKEFYPHTYVAKTLVVSAMIFFFWKYYEKISWKFWWLGIIAGVVSTVQWIGMELALLHVFPNYIRLDTKSYPGDPFIPFNFFSSPELAWAFIMIRWAGASLLVPVMEELFWRDYLWRTFLAPNNFRLARIGEWDTTTFLLIALLFGAGVHIQWATAIVWGLSVGALLVYTRSIGACIIMHGVTNFLLGAYVLYYRDSATPQWFFW